MTGRYVDIADRADAADRMLDQILKVSHFKQIVGTTGTTLYALEAYATPVNSMKLLGKAGMRPVADQEILPALMIDEKLKNELRELQLPTHGPKRLLLRTDSEQMKDGIKEKWFYLDDSGLDKRGIHTIDERLELIKLTGKRINKVSIEYKVGLWDGPNWKSLTIDCDRDSADCRRRFCLNADCEPDIAPLVVGVPIGNPDLRLNLGAYIKEHNAAMDAWSAHLAVLNSDLHRYKSGIRTTPV
jgi:hypothetical protein